MIFEGDDKRPQEKKQKFCLLYEIKPTELRNSEAFAKIMAVVGKGRSLYVYEDKWMHFINYAPNLFVLIRIGYAILQF